LCVFLNYRLNQFRPAILANSEGFFTAWEREKLGVFVSLETLVLKKRLDLSNSIVRHLTMDLGRSPSEKDLLTLVGAMRGAQGQDDLLLGLSTRATQQGRFLLGILLIHLRFKLLDTRGGGAIWASCEA